MSTGNFTVYRSSAGSGKTFTLVKEYLKILLGADHPSAVRNILALTFTNKAANEMRERVLSNLMDIGNGNTRNQYAQIILKESDIPEQEISERSKKAARFILHNYSDLGIGTIDRFVHRIIRSFSRDLDLEGDFEVEMDVQGLLGQAVGLVLEHAGKDPGLTRILEAFSLSRIQDDKGYDIQREMHELAAFLIREDNFNYVAQIRNYQPEQILELADKQRDELKAILSDLRAAGQALYTRMEQLGDESDFYRGASGPFRYAANCAFVRNRDTVIKGPGAYVLTSLEEGKWTSSKCPADRKAAIEAAAPELEQLLRSLIDTFESIHPKFIFIKAVSPYLYTLALLREIEEAAMEVRKQSNLLLISDFNTIVSDIIRKEPAPFIFERMGERYTHFMIDEFQDTSVLQWHNLLPLVSNALSRGGSSLIVGDAKQAIYRWRNGDVTQFLGLPEVRSLEDGDTSKEHERVLTMHYKEEPLCKNYRSEKHIIEFNNQLFQGFKDAHPEIADLYGHHAQKFTGSEEKGFVHFRFVDATERDTAERDRIATLMPEFINRKLAQGFELREIAILTRTNKEGSLIARTLLAKNIKVISEDSLHLSQSHGCRATISFLRWYLNREDSNAAIVLFHELQRLNPDLSIEDHLDLENTYHAHVRMQEILTGLGMSFNTNDRPVSVQDLLRQFYAVAGLEPSKDPYLITLSEQIHPLLVRNGFDVSSILEWWDHKGHETSVNAPENINAVQILTIHKSKGLEFPVVMLPYVSFSLGVKKDYEWLPNDDEDIPFVLGKYKKELSDAGFGDKVALEERLHLMDQLNLLYVACTRASEELHGICLSKSKDSLAAELKRILSASEGWNEEKSSYTYGEPEADRKEETSKSNASSASFSRGSEFIPFEVRELIIAENRPQDQKDYGVLMHAALSGITQRDEAERVVSNMHDQGLIPPELYLQMSSDIFGLMNSERVTSVAFPDEGEVLTEREIISDVQEVLRPDRIVLLPDGEARIIDFKTGRKRKDHRKQVKAYMEHLQQIVDGTIKGYLIYCESAEVEEVSL